MHASTTTLGRLLIVVILFAMNVYSTPLDDYVNTPDANYGWKRLQTYSFPTHTLYVINMTSQKWFDGMNICSI